MGLFSSSDPATHFPEVQGVELDGTAVAFPDDLPAEANLLIVAFRDALDPLADQWARLGDRLRETHGDRLAVRELPVVAKSLKMFGGLATVGVRGQIDDDAERARTVPIFVDKKAFCKQLACGDQGDVYVFLVDREGRIAWRGDGDIEMDEISALERAVAHVLSGEASQDGLDASEDGPDA